MIIGIGSDLCDIRRIRQSIDRFGERFLARVFTAEERRKAERRTDDGPNSPRTATYAKRFAAKEACAKALGTGFRQGVFWRDMGVVNLPGGQPTMALTGGALERLQRITPPGMVARIHLSMTDEVPIAMAYVIIEAVPAGIAAPAA
ncbi:MAG: holo-(acyl-carrier-protein) synthase [Pseudomonadota bacterium]|jgi:holo-[acyl-carrier protein] synthase